MRNGCGSRGAGVRLYSRPRGVQPTVMRRARLVIVTSRGPHTPAAPLPPPVRVGVYLCRTLGVQFRHTSWPAIRLVPFWVFCLVWRLPFSSLSLSSNVCRTPARNTARNTRALQPRRRLLPLPALRARRLRVCTHPNTRVLLLPPRAAYIVVREKQQVVLERCGRFRAVLTPGIHCIIPWVDAYVLPTPPFTHTHTHKRVHAHVLVLSPLLFVSPCAPQATSGSAHMRADCLSSERRTLPRVPHLA